MRTVVPFDASDPKTRLSPALGAAERRAFAAAMLRDVLGALRAAGHDPEVLATAAVEVDAPVTVDDRPLTAAVNAVLADAAPDRAAPLAVVMADLPLATPAALDRLADPTADVVLAPGLGGGTNAFLTRHPDFRVDYHGASYRDHREAAADIGAGTATVDSFRLGVDVDDPPDLAEVLLHSAGEAAAWLRDAGFGLSAGDGRTTVTREG